MTEEKTTTVEMTAEELEQLKEFRKQKETEAAEKKRKADMAAYEDLVDEQVTNAIALLRSTSDVIADAKRSVYDNFKQVLELKGELLKVKDTQRSHTFMSKDGTKRVTLGYRCVDSFRDTADDGVAMVKEALAELGTDEKSKALVNMVLSLLAKDSMGNLNAQRAAAAESGRGQRQRENNRGRENHPRGILSYIDQAVCEGRGERRSEPVEGDTPEHDRMLKQHNHGKALRDKLRQAGSVPQLQRQAQSVPRASQRH